MDRKIIAYSLEYQGIDHSQYFSGNGIAFTSWDDVFTGASDSPFNAGEDAIDQLATSRDVSNLDVIKNTLSKRIDSRQLHFEDCKRSKRYDAECDGCDDLYCYAALWIKYENNNESDISLLG